MKIGESRGSNLVEQKGLRIGRRRMPMVDGKRFIMMMLPSSDFEYDSMHTTRMHLDHRLLSDILNFSKIYWVPAASSTADWKHPQFPLQCDFTTSIMPGRLSMPLTISNRTRLFAARWPQRQIQQIPSRQLHYSYSKKRTYRASAYAAKYRILFHS